MFPNTECPRFKLLRTSNLAYAFAGFIISAILREIFYRKQILPTQFPQNRTISIFHSTHHIGQKRTDFSTYKQCTSISPLFSHQHKKQKNTSSKHIVCQSDRNCYDDGLNIDMIITEKQNNPPHFFHTFYKLLQKSQRKITWFTKANRKTKQTNSNKTSKLQIMCMNKYIV